MKTITIADSLFVQHTKSASGSYQNDVSPVNFAWEEASPQDARFVTETHIREAKGEGQVAWLLESFFLHPQNYIYLLEKKFDAVLTSNKYFAENLGWTWCPHGGSWIPEDSWGMHPKTKDVSMITTLKETMTGHRLRKEIDNVFGDRIDVYGRDSFFEPKIDALKDYRFSIVVQSERCPGFFDEKLIDCFAVGTIPIYWGCPNIDEYFNPGGIIEFTNIEQLGRILDQVDMQLHTNRIVCVENNMQISVDYLCVEDWLYYHHRGLFQ